MTTGPGTRVLPGAPRRTLAAVVVLVVATPAVGVSSGSDTAHLLLTVGVFAALWRVVHWRAQRVDAERRLWRGLELAAALHAGAAATGLVLHGTGAARDLVLSPLVWASIAAFPAVYGPLVLWNRTRTQIADPNDSVNGLAAVLGVVAVTDTVLAYAGGAAGTGPLWLDLPRLLQLGTAFVVLGTVATVTTIAGLRRDPRSWLLLGCFAADLVAAALTAGTGGAHVGWTASALMVLCTCLAAVLRPAPVTPHPTDPSATTVGAFVVVMASTAVLTLGALGGPGAVAGTWCAGIAAAAASLRLLFNVQDLSELAVSRREALTDDLTGLANRRAVLRRVRRLCGQGQPFVFALLDLDKFKEVNDGLGHAAGDDLLRLVGRRLESVLGPDAVVGRLGGDEFAIVVPAATPGQRDLLTDRLGADLCQWMSEPFDVGGLTLHVRISVGVARHDGRGHAAESCSTELLRHADTALYDAKRSGSGAVVHDATRHADNSGHLALVEELRTAIADGQLVLHHQPQVDVGTGRTVGAEALVRWQHPTRGLLSPAEFVPLAEVHGLMGAVTDVVLSQAVAQAARWRQQGLDLRLSVNLSASNLLDTALPERVDGLLRAHGVPPSALVLEVTETVLMSDPERSLAVVSALAELGATVSIDDFGTGYASLTYLRELPVAELKLDRSFTADLRTDPRTAAIVSSTIDLAHQLGLRVVAEGVEDPATLAHLKALSCDESQGFLHSPPLPAADLVSWLAVREQLLRA
ncbi:putative bifunctional diguanylate cyclase/phosphodiesterase [Modestobacter sp. I12A-02662]|uniref:putative bifunctional diguanylate cyclase/phosphodiesterase n=1 Tax=Modestobacter sp. I12A-02662 TaxID=1730496 RepID=UPI0034DF0251